MKQMKTAYVVTQGEYSEYRILGVYSTEEQANHVAEIRDGRVESYEVDVALDTPNGMKYYYVTMSFDGNRAKAHISDPFSYEHKMASNSKVSYSCYGSVTLHCWATDEKHAIKILNDRRIQMMASGELDAMRKEDEDAMADYNSRATTVKITKAGWVSIDPKKCNPASKDPVERVFAGDHLNQQEKRP